MPCGVGCQQLLYLTEYFVCGHEIYVIYLQVRRLSLVFGMPGSQTLLASKRSSVSQSPWIIGICSTVFDIDVGQTLRHLVPQECLSDEEKSLVAFHSFPVSITAYLVSTVM